MQYSFDFAPVLAAWPMFLEGAIQTLRMSAISMVAGLALGIVFMLMRISRLGPVRTIAIGYIEIIRNTPFLVQVFFIYFGMPTLGIKLGGEEAAILAMSLNCAAYAAEIVRGGSAVDPPRPDRGGQGAWPPHDRHLSLHRLPASDPCGLSGAMQPVHLDDAEFEPGCVGLR